MKNAKRFIIGVSAASIGLFCYAVSHEQPNALKVRVGHVSDVVRWPHADQYQQGEIIRIPSEDGSYYEAVVVAPISVETELIDDEIQYTQTAR